MKKIDWTKWSAIAEILSAMAILVTLLYLGVQTRYVAEQTELSTQQIQQNNRLLEAEARANQLASRVSFVDRLLEGVDLASIDVKLQTGESLTEVEEQHWFSFAIFNLIQWEWQYREYEAGTLGQQELPVGGWYASIRYNDELPAIWRSAWVAYRDNAARHPGFIQLMDERVFSE
jgi:hypothetical protein